VTARPQFLDEHAIEVAAPRDRVRTGLERYVDRTLTTGNGLAHRLLGTDPPPGFAVAAAVPGERLELAGRHRFANYVLAFELRDSGPGTTRLAARSYADFPGIHGRAYRALFIGTRLHVIATRRLLHEIRRSV
jgi:hypothetical protein